MIAVKIISEREQFLTTDTTKNVPSRRNVQITRGIVRDYLLMVCNKRGCPNKLTNQKIPLFILYCLSSFFVSEK